MRLRYLSQRLLQLCLAVLIIAVIIGYLLQHHKTSLPSTMPSQSSPQEVASSLLAEKGLDVVSITLLQSLWAGYGQICRIKASPKASLSKSQIQSTRDSTTPKDSQESHSYILKLITPPRTKINNEGHTRKILSYQIEQYFYTHLALQMPASIPVAKCLSSINEQNQDGTSTTAMILTDLKQDFPLAGEKRAALTPTQTLAALDWLSNFHGFWWSRVSELDGDELVLPPLEQLKRSSSDQSNQSIWLNGGYTYLATRLDEFTNLKQDTSSEWNQILTQPLPNSSSNLSLAESVAKFLTPTAPDSKSTSPSPISKYQTLIHGDVKSENLFTTTPGTSVAFYDFQYVGLGLGVSDLAKFFTCSVPESMLLYVGPACPRKEDGPMPYRLMRCDGESDLLERYWRNLVKGGNGGGHGDGERGEKEYEWHDFVAHYEVALVDWLRFQQSWGAWGNTEWLEARVRYILKYGRLEETLAAVA
jgi:thiamine kinase-like enzyme